MNERYFGTDDGNRRADDAFSDRSGRFGTVFGRGEKRSSQDRAGDGFYRSEEQSRANEQPYASSRGGYSSASSGAGGTVIYSPTTYEDVKLLIDHLKMSEQVIVDFSDVNQTSVYRILDFMSGAIYALGGSIKQITKNIFLFAPQGVTITVPPQLNRR